MAIRGSAYRGMQSLTFSSFQPIIIGIQIHLAEMFTERPSKILLKCFRSVEKDGCQEALPISLKYPYKKH